MTWNWANITGTHKSSETIIESGGHISVYKLPERGIFEAGKLTSSLNSLASNVNRQWNIWRSHLRPLLNSLPAGNRDERWNLDRRTDALIYGIQGSTLMVNNDATITSSNGRYWDSTYNRPKTIAESFEDLWDKVAYIESIGIESSAEEVDLTEYALLAGRSSGQILYGGTDSGDDLSLFSTSDTTKGSVFLGSSNSYFDGTGKLTITIPDNGSSSCAEFKQEDITNGGAAITIGNDYNSLSIANPDGWAINLNGTNPVGNVIGSVSNAGFFAPTVGIVSFNGSGSSYVICNAISDSSMAQIWLDTTSYTGNSYIALSSNSGGGISQVQIKALDYMSGATERNIEIGSNHPSAILEKERIRIVSGGGKHSSAVDQVNSWVSYTPLLFNGSELRLTDENNSVSTWTQPYVLLSDDYSDWETYKSIYGEVSLMNAINQAWDAANELPVPMVVPTTDQELIDALESTNPCTIILCAQDYTITGTVYTGATKVVLGTGYTGLTDDGTKSSRILFNGSDARGIRINDHGFTIKNTRLMVASDAIDVDYLIYVDTTPSLHEGTNLIDNCYFGSLLDYVYSFVYSGGPITISNCTFMPKHFATNCISISGSSSSCNAFGNKFFISGTSLSGSGRGICLEANGCAFVNFNNNYITGYPYGYSPSFQDGTKLINPYSDNVTIKGNVIDFSSNSTLSAIVSHTGNQFENFIFSENKINLKGDMTYVHSSVIKGRWERAIISDNIIETSFGSEISVDPGSGCTSAVFSIGGSQDVTIENNTVRPYRSGLSYDAARAMVYLDQRSVNIAIKNNNFLHLGSDTKTRNHYGIYLYRGSNYNGDYPIVGLRITDNVFSLYYGKEDTFAVLGTGDYLPSPWQEMIFKNNILPHQKTKEIDFSKFGTRFITDCKNKSTITDDYQIENYDSRINADASSSEIDLHLYCTDSYLKSGQSITVVKEDDSANVVNVLSKGFTETYSKSLSVTFDGYNGGRQKRYHNSIVFQDEFYFGIQEGDVLLKWDQSAEDTVEIYSGPGSDSSSYVRALAKYTEPSGNTDQILYFISYQYVSSESPSFSTKLLSYDGTTVTDLGGSGLMLRNLVVDNSTGMVYLMTDETNDRIYSYDPNTTTWTHLNLGDNSSLDSMIVYGGDLYVSKASSTIIYKWDGISWTTIDLTTELGVFGPYMNKQFFIGTNKLFVAGSYRNIASFDGTTWSLICSYADDFRINRFEYFCMVADENDEDIYVLAANVRPDEVYYGYSLSKVSLIHINVNIKALNLVNQIHIPVGTNYDDNTIKKLSNNKFIAMVSSKLLVFERTKINGDYSAVLSTERDYADLRFDGQDWWGTVG